MKYAEKIKKKLCKEIDEIGERNDLRASDIEMLYKMTDIVKNIDKISLLEEESGEGMSERSYRGGNYGSYRGGSYEGDSMRGGSYEGSSYDDGNSYARRGQHYVRGHYSYADDDMSMARGRNRGYSRSEAKDEMMNKLGHMMKEADQDERKILEKAMRQIDELDD